MVKKTIETNVKISNNGQTNFNHLSNPIFTIPNVANINPVGLINPNIPIPYKYVLTIISLQCLPYRPMET